MKTVVLHSDVADQTGRDKAHDGYCQLCGARIKPGLLVCWAHSWAVEKGGK